MGTEMVFKLLQNVTYIVWRPCLQMDRATVATLLLSIAGIAFACASFGLLIAEIGLWDTYYILDQGEVVSSGTVDSATTGYFSEDAIIACRALAITATILTFGTIIIAPVFLTSSLKMYFSLKIRKIVGTTLVSISCSAALMASITLIIVKTMLKSGMELDSSFYLGIAATILLVGEALVFVILILIAFRIKRHNVTDQNETKIQPIKMKVKKSRVTRIAKK